MEKIIGAQLYTIREFLTTPEQYAESLQKVKDIGYTTAQLSGGCAMTADQLAEISKNTGLELSATHRPYAEFKENLDGLIEFHHKIGAPIAGIGSMQRDIYGESKDGYLRFAEEFSVIADKLAQNGLTFSYHNHAFEFKKFDGKYGMDYLLENSSPNFKFTFDVYWLSVGGVDPERYLRKHASRIGALHYKDLIIEESKTQTMAEIMEGNLDWDGIIKTADDLAVKYIYVEQDVCKTNPFDCLTTSYNNLKTKGYK